MLSEIVPILAAMFFGGVLAALWAHFVGLPEQQGWLVLDLVLFLFAGFSVTAGGFAMKGLTGDARSGRSAARKALIRIAVLAVVLLFIAGILYVIYAIGT